VTSDDRTVAALAAVFAPAAAGALLFRLATPGAPAAREHAVRLAASSRDDRLGALAAALGEARPGGPGQGERAAAAERPRVARALRAIAAGSAPADLAPALARLCRGRLAARG
jgi:hypothetical protein